jgi:hypothetical protein
MSDEELDGGLPEPEELDSLISDGDEPEVDPDDDELVTDPVGEPDSQDAAPKEEKQISKASQAVMRAKAEAKTEREKAERLQQEMMNLLRERNSPQAQRGPDPEAERRYLENLSDSERIEYRLKQMENSFNTRLQQTALQAEIAQDKMTFASTVAARPEAKRYEAKVEERFQEYLRAGAPQTRQSILEKLIGEVWLKQGTKALSKARATGEANIRRETTRPASSRSNVSSEGAASDGGAEARLRKYFESGGQA